MATDLSWCKDQAYDLVYSISVFQHLPRPMVQNYLIESKRVARRCLHHFRKMTPAGEHPEPAKDIGIDHTGDFSCGWTVEEVEQAAKQAGLSPQVTESSYWLYLKA